MKKIVLVSSLVFVANITFAYATSCLPVVDVIAHGKWVVPAGWHRTSYTPNVKPLADPSFKASVILEDTNDNTVTCLYSSTNGDFPSNLGISKIFPKIKLLGGDWHKQQASLPIYECNGSQADECDYSTN